MLSSWPAGWRAPVLSALCCRTWPLSSLETNSCRWRRNLHFKDSCDRELMNYLQQFELDSHLHQIQFWFRPSLIKPPCLFQPGSFIGGAGKESARGLTLACSGCEGSHPTVLGRGETGKRSPSPGSQGSGLVGFQIWNQILGHLLKLENHSNRLAFSELLPQDDLYLHLIKYLPTYCFHLQLAIGSTPEFGMVIHFSS